MDQPYVSIGAASAARQTKATEAMIAARFAALVLALTTFAWASLARVAEPEKVIQLGEIKVDDYTGKVFFQDPADDGKSYRVTLAIPKPNRKPGIKSDRIEVWLLARGGKALATNVQPEGELLIEAQSGGTTANAIYFFDRSVEPGELRAVVVAVDGQPTALKLKAAK